MFILKLIIVIHNYLNLSSYHFRTHPPKQVECLPCHIFALLSMFMCVYNMHIYTKFIYIKIYTIFAYICYIHSEDNSNQIPLKGKIQFFFKLCRKENKEEVKGSKDHYFKFPSPYWLHQNIPGSTDFLFKKFSLTALSQISKIPQEYNCLFLKGLLEIVMSWS